MRLILPWRTRGRVQSTAKKNKEKADTPLGDGTGWRVRDRAKKGKGGADPPRGERVDGSG